MQRRYTSPAAVVLGISGDCRGGQSFMVWAKTKYRVSQSIVILITFGDPFLHICKVAHRSFFATATLHQEGKRINLKQATCLP
jgi:hypothetical protein